MCVTKVGTSTITAMDKVLATLKRKRTEWQEAKDADEAPLRKRTRELRAKVEAAELELEAAQKELNKVQRAHLDEDFPCDRAIELMERLANKDTLCFCLFEDHIDDIEGDLGKLLFDQDDDVARAWGVQVKAFPISVRVRGTVGMGGYKFREVQQGTDEWDSNYTEVFLDKVNVKDPKFPANVSDHPKVQRALKQLVDGGIHAVHGGDDYDGLVDFDSYGKIQPYDGDWDGMHTHKWIQLIDATLYVPIPLD